MYFREMRLPALAFAAIGASGAAIFLLTQNSLLSLLFALSLTAGAACYLGRKWHRDTARRLEVLQVSMEHQTAVTTLSAFLGGSPILWSEWAIAPESLCLILYLAQCLNVRKVLELGSGISTLFLAKQMQQCANGIINSFDHELRWAMITNQNLTERGLGSIASVRVAPLVEVQVNGDRRSWYCLPKFPWGTIYDLILVDGPPSSSTDPLARLPALPQLRHVMGENTLLILDDADREWESEVIKCWQRGFPELKFKRVSTPRGMLIVTKSATELVDLLLPR
jgi:predicted O-methyltransferase YrrM